MCNASFCKWVLYHIGITECALSDTQAGKSLFILSLLQHTRRSEDFYTGRECKNVLDNSKFEESQTDTAPLVEDPLFSGWKADPACGYDKFQKSVHT